MIKRLMSVLDREGDRSEKAKAWIIIIFLIAPALSGYFAIWRKLSYWLTPQNEGFFQLTQSGIYALDTITICMFIFALAVLISAVVARNNYRFATVLKEAEKGYHEPITSQFEPISELDDVREVMIQVRNGSETKYMPMDMTETQAISYWEMQELSAQNIKHLLRNYKGWGRACRFLEDRRIRANSDAIRAIPETIGTGFSGYLPLE